MAKFNLKKKSKRQPARLRYKIEKKVRQHNKKLRRETKKNPKKNKKDVIQIPNICPFKENIVKEIEIIKKQKEEEMLHRRQMMKLERQKQKKDQKNLKVTTTLEQLVASAEMREKVHEHVMPGSTEKTVEAKTENSLKQHYKEFKKVIEEADVILEVVDARDPMGTRCAQVEEDVRGMKANKKLVLVLNKADLVPRENLDKWLKYLRKTTPAIAFKASTQIQSKKLGQRKFSKSVKGLQGSSSVGAELLMSLLANYCRNNGIKTSIRVGVVGLPNVGKSSIINSLKRSRACNIGASPGITRVVQEVQLDSKIKILDSPGIVFATGNDSSAALRNAIRISSLNDPITPANAILQRVTKQQMMEMYDITEYATPDEFFTLKAIRSGKFKKGGIPDTTAAARSLLEDWNNGKIKYHTLPPEENENDTHVSSSIVTDIGKEFDLDAFESMEIEALNAIEKESWSTTNSLPENRIEDTIEAESKDLLNDKINVTITKNNKKNKVDVRKKKVQPEMELEGNRKLNQVKKKQFKKEKKRRLRREKVEQQLTSGLENVSLNTDKNVFIEDYNFDTDFSVK